MPEFPLAPIRRTLFTTLALGVLSACGSEDTNIDTTVVASVAGDTLTAAGLRDILLLSPIPPNDDLSASAVGIWSDLAVVTAAAASGATLDDEASLAEIMRPAVMERTIERYAESRAGTATPTAAQIDSVARGNTVRVFRRYAMRPVAQSDTTALMNAVRRLSQLKAQALTDGSVTAALRTLGDQAAGIEVDPPIASRREETPEALARTIWRLNENDVSDPVFGGGAVQIFERVPAGTARETVAAWLTPVLQRRVDGRYIDSILTSRGLAIVEDGSNRLRAAAHEPGTFASDAPLATWSSGDLSTGEVRSWLASMPAPERTRMRLEADTTLTRNLTLMARREILFEVAVEAGIDTIAARDEVLPATRERVAQLLADAQATNDPSVWFRDILEGRREMRVLPGALAKVLRDRTAVTVDNAGRELALREAIRTWQQPATPPTP